MQIIQIHAHASKVRHVRESGFWDELDDDITQIVAPVAEMGRNTRKRSVTRIEVSIKIFYR
jgi:hypothetical protein